MKRRIALLGWLVFLLGSTAPSQAFQQGYVAIGASGTLYRIDANGGVQSMTISTAGLAGLAVDYDNQHVLVGVPAAGAVLRVDPDALTVAGTLATGLGRPAGLVLDPNGDVIVADGSGGRLLRVDRSGLTSTLLLDPTVLRSPQGGMLINISDTSLLVQDAAASHGAPLLAVRRTDGRVATLATGLKPGFGLAQDICTGDLFVASTDTGQVAIYRLARGASTAVSWLPPSTGLQSVASLATDRASSIQPRLLVGAFNTSPASRGLYTVDLATRSVSRIADIADTLTGVAFARSRNLAALRTGPAEWTLKVSFPGRARFQYVVLPSLHGVYSNERLPDGRRICLVPDGITQFLVYEGDMYPFTHSFRGVLGDGGTSGNPRFTLSVLGPWARGLVVWMAPVSIDVMRTFGVADVGDPIAVQLE
jgi:hypothetical protein